mmetsp:Transcript_29434/g.75566  ORF Transcript_29434/g.75566 Transcript_29434/m.75566 type:complete len:288 (-) Transcript_29434:741-1604(-)
MLGSIRIPSHRLLVLVCLLLEPHRAALQPSVHLRKPGLRELLVLRQQRVHLLLDDAVAALQKYEQQLDGLQLHAQLGAGHQRDSAVCQPQRVVFLLHPPQQAPLLRGILPGQPSAPCRLQVLDVGAMPIVEVDCAPQRADHLHQHLLRPVQELMVGSEQLCHLQDHLLVRPPKWLQDEATVFAAAKISAFDAVLSDAGGHFQCRLAAAAHWISGPRPVGGCVVRLRENPRHDVKAGVLNGRAAGEHRPDLGAVMRCRADVHAEAVRHLHCEPVPVAVHGVAREKGAG